MNTLLKLAAQPRRNPGASFVAFVRDRWVTEVEAFLEIDYTPYGRQPVARPRPGV